MNNFTQTVARFLKKNGPTIATVAGIVGITWSTIEACKQTTKIDPILEEHTKTMDDIQLAAGTGIIVDKETSNGVEFTEKDRKKATVKCYGRTVKGLGKLYWKPTLGFITSSAMILGSHKVMVDRNENLTAAAVTSASALNNCYEFIRNKYGEEAEREVRYGIEKEVVKKGKKGEPDEVREVVKDPNLYDFSFFYGPHIKGWAKNDKEYNLLSLKTYEYEVNRKMAFHSFDKTISIADIYNMIGYVPADPRIAKAAKVWGYRFDRDKDPVDERGIPDKFRFIVNNIYCIPNGQLTTLNHINPYDENIDSVMLVSMPTPELIIE